jgi:hypothetical protein
MAAKSVMKISAAGVRQPESEISAAKRQQAAKIMTYQASALSRKLALKRLSRAAPLRQRRCYALTRCALLRAMRRFARCAYFARMAAVNAAGITPRAGAAAAISARGNARRIAPWRAFSSGSIGGGSGGASHISAAAAKMAALLRQHPASVVSAPAGACVSAKASSKAAISNWRGKQHQREKRRSNEESGNGEAGGQLAKWRHQRQHKSAAIMTIGSWHLQREMKINQTNCRRHRRRKAAKENSEIAAAWRKHQHLGWRKGGESGDSASAAAAIFSAGGIKRRVKRSSI